MSTAPVGSAMPNTKDKSTFPGIGLTCHFIAGDTSENPELPRPRTVAKYVGTSSSSSRQGAIPRRHRVFVPSTIRPPSRALKFTPFSLWRLPTGTTRLEFVTSGRSVAISSLAVGQEPACASTAPRTADADSKNIWRLRLLTETLIMTIELGLGQLGITTYFVSRASAKSQTLAPLSDGLGRRRFGCSILVPVGNSILLATDIESGDAAALCERFVA